MAATKAALDAPALGEGRELLPDERTLYAVLERGDELELVVHAIRNFRTHPRINTMAKLCAILTDPNGPTLKDALSLDTQSLRTKHRQAQNLPLLAEEHQMRQLEEAIAFYYGSAAPPAAEKAAEEAAAAAEEEEETAASTSSANPYHPWVPRAAGVPRNAFARAVWYRINVGIKLAEQVVCQFGRDHCFHQKMLRFLKAHTPLVRYLDSVASVDEAYLCSLYVSPGRATYPDDLDLCRVTKTLHTLRPTPLQVIEARWPAPTWLWRVEQVLELEEELQPREAVIRDVVDWTPVELPPGEYRIYYACIHIINQCRRLALECQDANAVDALWRYRCGFVDVFFHQSTADAVTDAHLLTPAHSHKRRGGGTEQSDEPSPWELHGSHLDVRTFHAGDLPDLFHMLHSIPLWGEQCTPTTAAGKTYQKALPFACQRRLLINFITTSIAQEPALASLLCKLFWVTLAALYPGEATRAFTRISFRDVVRAKELTSSPQLLLEAINMCDTHKNGAPLVVYTAIRQHIVYMVGMAGPTYAEYARYCVAWDAFVRNTTDLAVAVRESNLHPQDAFARARAAAIKTTKSEDALVHRLRRKGEAPIISARLNEVLEKTILKDRHDRLAAAAAAAEDEMIDYYDSILRIECKAAIVNALIRTRPERRLSEEALMLLTLPEYGGIALETVAAMRQLVDIYRRSGKPLEFARCIDTMDGRDFVVAAFYYNTVATLANIDFVPLPAAMVVATDEAMLTHRHHGEHELPRFCYQAYISLCCERVLNLSGTHVYGTKYVAYDIHGQQFVCTKKGASAQHDDHQGNSSDEEAADEAAEDEAGDGVFFNLNSYVAPLVAAQRAAVPKSARTVEIEERKAVRMQRKEFNRIPCGQPVLMVPLRGFALLWGNRLEKQQLHLFCPRCAAFHMYSPMGWRNSPDGTYRCNACARQEHRHLAQPRCAYCSKTTPSQMSPRYKLLVSTVTLREGEPPQAWLYFCRTHYEIAKRFSSRMMKRELWAVVQKVEARNRMAAAKKQ